MKFKYFCILWPIDGLYYYVPSFPLIPYIPFFPLPIIARHISQFTHPDDRFHIYNNISYLHRNKRGLIPTLSNLTKFRPPINVSLTFISHSTSIYIYIGRNGSCVPEHVHPETQALHRDQRRDGGPQDTFDGQLPIAKRKLSPPLAQGGPGRADHGQAERDEFLDRLQQLLEQGRGMVQGVVQRPLLAQLRLHRDEEVSGDDHVTGVVVKKRRKKEKKKKDCNISDRVVPRQYCRLIFTFSGGEWICSGGEFSIDLSLW